METWAFVVLILAGLWQLLPINTLLAKCINDNVLETQDVKYSETAIYFSNDYDTEYPLTATDGQKRLLQYRIDAAGDDEEQKAFLQAQMGAISQQNPFQAMQAYSMQANARQMAYNAQFNPVAQPMVMQQHNMIAQQQMMHAQAMMNAQRQQAQMAFQMQRMAAP